MRKIFLNNGSSLLLAVLVLAASNLQAAFPAMPELSLTPGLAGESAITALGTNLAAVAAHYGKTSAQLQSLLQTETSLRLDGKGMLYYVCEGLAVSSNGPVVAGPPVKLLPLTNTFFLHSKPGSTRTIYLDFGGYTISGTQWNTFYNNGNDIVAPPWDIDGNPASFGTNEQAIIQQVWFSVAEDYAPFDVDVTTEYPGESALTRSSLGDQFFGVRALISPISAIIAPNAGGVSYVGVFNEVGDIHKPSLIFPEQLQNNPKFIAEAVSHEVGHSVGLLHQGTDINGVITDYYNGQGDWAPIMGVGYYKPIVQWAKGEYLNANNQEDELAIITSTGLNYRSADFGNAFNTASLMPGVNSSTNGIIAHTGESDFFYFQTGSGTASITFSNWPLASDLHAILTIYDGSQNIITNLDSRDNAAGTHGINLNLPVANGKYYVAITGRGARDPLTTGYSAYASLGQYTLNITNPFPLTTPSTPVTAPHSPWGTTLSVMNGSDPNGNWYLFVQDDKQLDIGAINSGWYLNLTSANPVGFAADNQLYSSPDVANVNLGANWTVAVCVTNYGPSASTNIVVTDVMPIGAGLSYVGNAPSQGSVVQFGSSLVWSVGNLATNTGAKLNVTFSSSAIGTYTNSATVTAATTDPNPDNDATGAIANVGIFSPSAFGSVTFASGKPTFTITNAGGAMSTIIQATTNLAAPISWLSIHTNTTPFSFTDASATNYPVRFYRAILGP